MFLNVVVGEPLLHPHFLIAKDLEDWETNEKKQTLFTNERNLAKILVEAGVVSSKSEVRRNQPHLDRILDTPDCLEVKWGKKKIFIVVGPINKEQWEKEHDYDII